jgi:hypothetical protein
MDFAFVICRADSNPNKCSEASALFFAPNHLGALECKPVAIAKNISGDLFVLFFEAQQGNVCRQ